MYAQRVWIMRRLTGLPGVTGRVVVKVAVLGVDQEAGIVLLLALALADIQK